MSMVKQILKCPRLWLPYAKKYAVQLKRYVKYKKKDILSGIRPQKKKEINKTDKLAGQWPSKFCLIPANIDFLTEQLPKEEIQKIKEEADLILKGSIPILRQRYENVYDTEYGHYLWNVDFSNGNRYKKCFGRFVRLHQYKAGSEIKIPWEFSRLQYLFPVGVMWRVSKDPKYAEKIIQILEDWIDENPVDQGVNWNIAMEAGIRALNMILSCELISNYTGFTENIRKKIAGSLNEHFQYILDNLENIDYVNNHYLGDVLGILAISASCPFLDNKANLFRWAVEEFNKEICLQILDDGSCAEGTTAYHRLDTEMFSIAGLIMKNNSVELKNHYKERLIRMSEYADAITDPAGKMLLIGDNDSGRILCLTNSVIETNEFASSLAAFLGTGRYERKAAETAVLTGIKNQEQKNAFTGLKYFPEFNQAIIQNNKIFLSYYNIDARKHSVGSHSHNDRLSFVLYVQGTPFLVDPGSGCYTSRPEINKYLRSAASHSTVQIDNKEQNTYSIDQKRPNEVQSTAIDIEKQKTGYRLTSAIHYTDCQDGSIHRTLDVKENEIIITDHITCDAQKKIYIRFVTAPDIEIRTVNACQLALIGQGIQLQLLTEREARLKQGYYSELYGKWVETTTIEIELDKPQNHVTTIRQDSKTPCGSRREK